MQAAIEKRSESRRMNVLKKIMIVQNLVSELYEPGNQSKSKAQAYRKQVNNAYPMGERTFWRYMGVDVNAEMRKAQKGQLTLPFEDG